MDIYVWSQVCDDGSCAIRMEGYIPGEPFDDGPEFGVVNEGFLWCLMDLIENNMLTTFDGCTFKVQVVRHPSKIEWVDLKVDQDLCAFEVSVKLCKLVG